jgi:hypothetical protein
MERREPTGIVVRMGKNSMRWEVERMLEELRSG